MQGSLVAFPETARVIPRTLETQLKHNPYYTAEDAFIKLVEVEDLDRNLQAHSSTVSLFENALTSALEEAYQTLPSEAAHRFIQRVLYRINRLNLFWYDDLRHYTNERSLYLHQIRDRIETAWQQWELSKLAVDQYQSLDAKQALLDRFAADLDPPISIDADDV
jgi:hypothetical protein